MSEPMNIIPHKKKLPNYKHRQGVKHRGPWLLIHVFHKPVFIARYGPGTIPGAG